MPNAVTWFEIGGDRPERTERFYGDLFGWTFEEQGAPGRSYRVTEGAGGGIGGAIRATEDLAPYAVFYVQVADVADTCARAEAAGGRVLLPPTAVANGLSYAHLGGPSGERIGIFTPPPA